MIPIPSPGVPLRYGDTGAPLAVILPDEFGRLPWLEHYAAAMAGRGRLRVLVLDLYGGVATTDEAEAADLLGRLNEDDVRDLLDAGIGEALDQGSRRVGLVGFGTGATLALRAAQRGDADAVVAYDGILTAGDPGILPCPVQLHVAETAEELPAAAVEDFRTRVRDDGTPIVVHTYLGTGRLFANATLTERVDGRAAALAFARSTVFLQQRLAD